VTIGDYDHLDGYYTKFISEEDYLAKALLNVEERFGKLELLFPRSKLGSPASLEYDLEIDTTGDATSLQNYVETLHWAVKISRIDLAHVAATMARFMASPREGHLAGILMIFACLKLHMNSKIVIDPFEPVGKVQS